MARWTDLADWVGPTPNQGGPMNRHDGVVLHIAAGSYLGTIAWQRNPGADVSSHFIVSKTGKIAQMVDTDVTAWTQRDGNGEWLSVENEGFLPDKLTAAQVEANARILARAHRVYGVPLQVTGTPAKRGLGHHSMGAENGLDWGHSACPGTAIKNQKPEIVARAIQIVNGDDDMSWTEDVIPTPKEVVDAATNPTYMAKNALSEAWGHSLRAARDSAAGRAAAERAAAAAERAAVAAEQAAGQVQPIDYDKLALALLRNMAAPNG